MRLALALCALVLLTGACGGPRTEAPRQVRSIVYWEKWTDFEGEAMQRVVDDFNERERERGRREAGYVPIQVEMVVISRIEQKLLVACAGGNPPDLAGAYTYSIPSFSDKGALVDLTDLARESGIDRSDYVEQYYDLNMYRGRLWGLPTTPASVALHWNKRLFREAGLDPEKPPQTLEELDEFAEKLTKWEITLPSGETRIASGYLPDVPASQKRLIQVGFLPTEPSWWYYGWGFIFGGKLIDGDRITTAAPENVAAYEWVAQYSRRLGVEAVQRFRSGFGSFASAQNPFLSGQLAMQIQGVWMHNFIKKFADGMPWGAAPFPAPSAHPELHGVGNAEADALVIPTGSPHQAEAWEFIKYVQRPEVMEKLCLGQRKHSSLKQVSDAFWSAHPNPYIRMFAEVGAHPHAYSAPKTGIWNQYGREMSSAVDRIQNLRVSPADALMDVQERMQVAADRDRKIYDRRQR